MMNNEMKREYANEVVKSLEAMAPEMKYEVKAVNKNHSIFTGIVASKADSKIAPTVYVDGFIEDSMPADEAAKKILAMVNESYKNMPSMAGLGVETFANYETMKDKLSFVLTGDKEYADQFALREVGAGLYAIPIVKVEMGNGECGSIKITKQHVKGWGIDMDTLYADANEVFSKETIAFGGIGEFLGMGMGMEPVDAPMCVASNDEKVNGAAVMLSPEFDKMCLSKYPEGYYILPSSVHEVIVVSRNLAPVCALENMVRDVNATVVRPEEVLCDNVLAIENGKIVIATDNGNDKDIAA